MLCKFLLYSKVSQSWETFIYIYVCVCVCLYKYTPFKIYMYICIHSFLTLSSITFNHK